MASFKAKVGWQSTRKEENKNFSSISFLSEKLKNTIMASFQAKVSWESPGNGENKNFRSISYLPVA